MMEFEELALNGDLPDIEVVVEMDYPPDEKHWNATVLQPEDWDWHGRGSSADEVCEAAYSAATREFGDVMMLYRYTDRSIKQCIVEDSTNPDVLSCEICTPPDEEEAF